MCVCGRRRRRRCAFDRDRLTTRINTTNQPTTNHHFPITGDSGRWVRVRKYEQQANGGGQRQQGGGRPPSEKPEGCTSVFIGNLSWNIDEDTIRQAFASCGEVRVCVCVCEGRRTSWFGSTVLVV